MRLSYESRDLAGFRQPWASFCSSGQGRDFHTFLAVEPFLQRKSQAKFQSTRQIKLGVLYLPTPTPSRCCPTSKDAQVFQESV